MCLLSLRKTGIVCKRLFAAYSQCVPCEEMESVIMGVKGKERQKEKYPASMASYPSNASTVLFLFTASTEDGEDSERERGDDMRQ